MDNGATWTALAPLNTNAATDSGHDYAPQVTTDGAGTWVAVWESGDSLGGTIGADYDILFARGCMSPSELDTDGDGLTDCDELLIYGTDPLVANRIDDVNDLLNARSNNYVCVSPPGIGTGATRDKARSDVQRTGFVTATDMSTIIANLDNALPFTTVIAARSDVRCTGFVTATDLSATIANLD